MTEEKRSSERKESMIVIEFRKAGTTDDYYAGITHNFSDDGFSFESEALALQSGPVLDFKLKHPGRDETINFLGVVVWTTKQKYSLVAGVKFQTLQTEKQNILAEIISLSPTPADSVTRKEVKPVQLPSAEDPDPVRKENDSGVITESIVAAVRNSGTEETGSTEEKDISEAVPPEVRTERFASAPKETGSTEEKDISEVVPPEVRTERSGSASKVKNRPWKLARVLITVLIVLASVVLAGYLIHNSSTERLMERPPSLLMSRNTVPEVLPRAREDELPFDEDSPSESLNKGPETVETVPEVLSRDREEALPLDEDSLSESLNKGPETVETVAGGRFIIHVSAWKTKRYAMSFNKKVMSFYPDTIMVFENNYYIIMVPNIVSHEEALSIAEELAGRFDVSPLIYVQRRSIPK